MKAIARIKVFKLFQILYLVKKQAYKLEFFRK